MASLYRNIANSVSPRCLRLLNTSRSVVYLNLTTNKSIYAPISSSYSCRDKTSSTSAAAGTAAAAAAICLSISAFNEDAADNNHKTTLLNHSNYGHNSGILCKNNFTANYNVLMKSPEHQQLLQPQPERQHTVRNFSSLQMPILQPSKLVQHHAMAPLKNRRHICTREISKNMTLYTNEPFKGDIDNKTLQIKNENGNPLVLIMAWLMAKQKHLKKYAEIYTDLGFDALVVHCTPWQLLWPVKGTQIVAGETLKFLENNKSYAPIVVHGFSVGAYQFGEILLQMARDMERYGQLMDRIACQIWDSAADITEIPVGLPKSIFPKNPRMQTALRNYTLYHLKTFHNQATIHYMRSSQIFHATPLKKPALFYVSEDDPIGPPKSNNAVRENWERANIKVTFKCWERSMHTSHFLKHRDEYLELLFKHLEECGVIESVGAIKSRAKL